jgi:hypothetical protein
MMLASEEIPSAFSAATDSSDEPKAAGCAVMLSAPKARQKLAAAAVLAAVALLAGALYATRAAGGASGRPSEYLEFLGASSFEQHEVVLGTEMGGISGLAYHAQSDEWYS